MHGIVALIQVFPAPSPHTDRSITMGKGMDSKKSDKKAPAKTMKEKKEAKNIKKAEKGR